jgi:hypothetical protein
MLGNLAWTFPINTTTGTGNFSKEQMIFAADGKMIKYGPNDRPVSPKNTTISAVIVVERLRIGEPLCVAWLKDEEQKLGRSMTWEESLKAIETCTGTPKDISRTELRVVVHHNPYARIRWPENLFIGSWDEHVKR